MNNRNLIRYLSRFTNEELEESLQLCFRDDFFYHFMIMNQMVAIPDTVNISGSNEKILGEIMDYLEATND